MTDAAQTYPVPQTDEEEAALQKALATFHLQKLEAAKALFAGAKYKAFRAELEALIATKLPSGSATQQNADNLMRFLDTTIMAADMDVVAADRIVNPPADIVPAPPIPPIPATA